jgi:hypothetical protein
VRFSADQYLLFLEFLYALRRKQISLLTRMSVSLFLQQAPHEVVHKKFTSWICNICSLNLIFVMNSDAYRPVKLSDNMCVWAGCLLRELSFV